MRRHAQNWFAAFLLAASLALVSGRATDFDYSAGFVGLRFVTLRDPPALRVISVVPLGPAAKAGVEINDLITVVNGVSVQNLTPEQKHEAFSGLVGGGVKLILQRGDAPLQEVEVVRLSFQDALLPAATNGDAQSAELMGGFYKFGPSSSRDPKQALYWYTRAANLDDKVAELELGLLYYAGNGAAMNLKTASEWFRKSAHHGYAPAEYWLGRMYDEGEGVEQNHYSAVGWLLAAASQGHAQAEQLLGWHYFYGIGVNQNDGTAFYWTQAAAHQDDPAAEELLGELYYWGHGVKQSDVDSFKWNYRSAQQDNAKAECALGYAYQIGRGVARDDRSAFAWTYRSAEQGSPYGAWGLSYLYEVGRGVPRNLTEAYRWIRVAQAGLPNNTEIQKSAAILSLGAFTETSDLATVDVSLVLTAFRTEIIIAFAVLAFIYAAMGISLLAHGLTTTIYPPRLWQAFAWAAFFVESQFVALLAIFLFGKLLSADLLFVVIVVLGALPLVLSTLGKTRRQIWRPSSASWKVLLLYAVGGYVGFMVVEIGYQELCRATTGSSLPSQPTLALISKAKDASEWIAYASVAIALPVAEEVLFRGYFFDALRQRFSGLFVVVATAFGFSIYHCQGFYILPLFAFGLMLGLLKLRTNSLFPGLAIHVLNNAVMLAFS